MSGDRGTGRSARRPHSGPHIACPHRWAAKQRLLPRPPGFGTMRAVEVQRPSSPMARAGRHAPRGSHAYLRTLAEESDRANARSVHSLQFLSTRLVRDRARRPDGLPTIEIIPQYGSVGSAEKLPVGSVSIWSGESALLPQYSIIDFAARASEPYAVRDATDEWLNSTEMRHLLKLFGAQLSAHTLPDRLAEAKDVTARI